MKTNHRIAAAVITAFIVLSQGPQVFSQDRPDIPKKLDPTKREVLFSSRNFQAGIRGDRNIGALARGNSILGEDATSFGFAAKSEEAKFFILGALFSEALAFTGSDKLDLAANRLESMETEFINLGVPGSLYNYVSRVRNMAERKQFPNEALLEFLALFQPVFEDYARTQSEDKLILFRAGSWLVDMSVGAAAGDLHSLRQGARLEYFIEEMKRMDAPKGSLEALNAIAEITKKKELTEKDAKEVLKLVKKIQTILG